LESACWASSLITWKRSLPERVLCFSTDEEVNGFWIGIDRLRPSDKKDRGGIAAVR
jgi:hypothetical protein